MNKTVAFCSLIAAGAAWIVLSISAPWVLSDQNTFLKGFVTHELLAFFGILVTVTLASAANLHLTLNQLEESLNADGVAHQGFPKTRRSIRSAATLLMWLLVGAVALVIAKPLSVGAGSPLRESLFNGLAVLMVLAGVLALVDLTQTIFVLGPRAARKKASVE